MAKKKKVEVQAKPCINISVISCWNCKSDMIDAYYSDDLSIPRGPSYFTEKQMKIAIDEGCIIKETFSKTMQVSYPASICPNCGSMHGDFFYHDYAYVPGDVQCFLDNDDNVIEKVINKELV
ncbi:MAG: hypothetical protein GX864_02410 [Mollicutes bacterium]|jgi:hypothetical protein|nr:hypothetical protein [Mollicutes bacterium]